MVMKDTKISQKMKSKSWLSVEKKIKWEKMPYYNYNKRVWLRNVDFFSGLG